MPGMRRLDPGRPAPGRRVFWHCHACGAYVERQAAVCGCGAPKPANGRTASPAEPAGAAPRPPRWLASPRAALAALFAGLAAAAGASWLLLVVE